MAEDFATLLADAQPHVRRFALSLTRNRDDAEDLAQDTLLLAWRARHTFEPGTKLLSWLFTICNHHRLTTRRRLRNRMECAPGRVEQLVDLRSYAAPQQEAAVELRETLDAIDRLRPKHRVLLLGGIRGNVRGTQRRRGHPRRHGALPAASRSQQPAPRPVAAQARPEAGRRPRRHSQSQLA